MDRFFVRMHAIYRHLWSSSFDTDEMLQEAQKEWLDTFYRAGLTWDRIAEGITRCKQTYHQPPTPAQFLALLPHRGRQYQVHRSLPEPAEARKERMEQGKRRMRELRKMVTQTDGGQTNE